VFGASTDSDQLALWWGPAGFTIPAIEFDPRVGGSYRIEMKPPEGDPFALIGEEPNPDDVDMLVELALRQRPFRTEARRQLHREGWSDTLDKLPAWL
jgi:hypothetical protein